MTKYETAASKADAVARMYYLGGRGPEALGPGSKEKRSALESLARAIMLDLSEVSTKAECGRVLATRLRVNWDATCFSAGDTITLTGMNRLVDGVVEHMVAAEPGVEERLVRELMILAPVPRGSEGQGKGLHMDTIAADTQNSIAEFIAELSQEGDAPNGREFIAANLLADEVKFSDGSWRAHLASVQGWLALPEDLDQTSAEEFDRSLARALGFDPNAVDTEAVAARLVERLELAATLRTAFEDALEASSEGGATIGSATQQWNEAWQGLEEEEESESVGPIVASADTWPISEFVQLASDDDLELSPSYQRADVWPTADAQQLIESVLRGIPLPSIILLKELTEDGTRYDVVDGKQRLTSLLRFTGKHPVALETVRAKALEWGIDGLEDIFHEDYPKFRKLWKQHELESLTAKVERRNYFPFALRKGNVKSLDGDLQHLRGHYYSEIRKDAITIVGEKRKLYSLFEQVSKYKIPVIVYESATPAQVHEVFSLYNKQGKHLNAEEIRNALYHHLALMRGLLITAGDSENIELVAPFLAAEWDDLQSTPVVLDDYGFGKAGYKRTKVLSWVLAALVVQDDSQEITRSTAAHINLMLKQVADNRRSKFRDEETVLDAMLLLDHAVDALAVIPAETWAPGFKHGKWQELQLVGTLVGLAAACATYGDDTRSIVDARLNALAEASASEQWRRPRKTQSKEQWKHTGRVVASIMEILDVDPDEAHDVLVSRYGSSGLDRLVRMSTLTDE
ncbi:DUF262 domain-containing protein [Demequina flava]|uniref:DUF262 domain-containing protein n=1 Tax=Demequina flava TaxID=1095025 RepID=UPI000AB54273|nr:DUF262 domain-containing protein [Demequina flava]